jgi:hypothetical protein
MFPRRGQGSRPSWFIIEKGIQNKETPVEYTLTKRQAIYQNGSACLVLGHKFGNHASGAFE